MTNMEGISKNKASLAEYRYRFGITRPVPVIVNGNLRLTTKVRTKWPRSLAKANLSSLLPVAVSMQPEEVFIHLLKRLAMPPPTWSTQPDVVVDHENLMSLIVSNSSFLERHWRKLVGVGRRSSHGTVPHAGH